MEGANQAAAAAKLGMPTYFIGQVIPWNLFVREEVIKVGSDSNGEFVTDALSKNGVNVSFLKEVEEPTGTAVVILQPSGAPIFKGLSRHSSL